MENYEKGELIGEGQFGKVHKGQCKKTGRRVALKRVMMGDKSQGINMTALREVKLLRELRELHSDYVLDLIDVFVHKGCLVLVSDFMQADLEHVIRDQTLTIGQADVKGFFRQLLLALRDVHSQYIMHRDVKPNNLLIDENGNIKLTDFGLSRVYGSPSNRYTSAVFARWYRAPELFFGAKVYTSSVDMWAAGCVFAELLNRSVWLPGSSDIDQLGKIFKALGTPTEQTWPGVSTLPNYVTFAPTPAPSLAAQFPKAPDDAIDLLSQLVALNPSARLTADQALNHRYFTNLPQPTKNDLLPRPPTKPWNLKTSNGEQANKLNQDTKVEQKTFRIDASVQIDTETVSKSQVGSSMKLVSGTKRRLHESFDEHDDDGGNGVLSRLDPDLSSKRLKFDDADESKHKQIRLG